MDEHLSRENMNAQYHAILSKLLINAERDVRLAQADGNKVGSAKAKARLDTLQAALEIYAACHKHAYGVRPWPREVPRAVPHAVKGEAKP